jgi:hypothetical protein
MGLFLEWMKTKILNEGIPAGFVPKIQFGNDPLKSAIDKIRVKTKMGEQPFSHFTDSQVFGIRFGLNPQEIEALRQAKLLVRTSDGVSIDQRALTQYTLANPPKPAQGNVQMPPPRQMPKPAA